MAFGYTTTTLSGIANGTSVPIDTMQFIKNYMTGTLGWTLTEDRSTQASPNSKIIVQSNGEDNTASTFYMIMTSGTNSVGIQAATFWSTSTHTVGSGVATPNLDTTVSLNAQDGKIMKYWISGDKDAVNFISRRGGLNYDGVHLGRIRSLYPASADPFPIYVIGSSAESDIDNLSGSSSNVHSFLDASTILTNNEADWDLVITSPLGPDETPDNIFGSTERFTCFPLIAGVSDNSPVRRAVRGFSMNIWGTIGPNSSSLEVEDVFQAADGKTYQVFFSLATSSTAVVIRRS